MKIQFTQHRTLAALSRTVKPGDTLQSPDVPDELMRAYVQNGIAKDITPKPAEEPAAPASPAQAPAAASGPQGETVSEAPCQEVNHVN